MNFNLKKILLVLFSLSMIFVFFLFRSIPVTQFWKDYRILYVFTENLSENDILTILEKNGCDSVVSYGKQKVPLLSPIAPVQIQDNSSYLLRRNEFFMDKNHKALVFYVPENYASGLERTIRELSAFQGTDAGTDGKSSFPWRPPLISFAFFLFLFYFSEKRNLFFLGSISFIVLSFTRPLYALSAATSLFIFGFFLFHRLWGRKNFVKTNLNSPYIMIFWLSPILVLIFSSPILSIFYVLALFSSASLVYLYRICEKKKNASFAFNPVFIRSAKMLPILGRNGFRFLLVLLGAIAAIFAVFSISGNVSNFAASTSLPSLPSPVARSQEELVSIKDFAAWSFDALTFPFKKIGSENLDSNSYPQEGEVVAITDYIEETNPDGTSRIVPVRTPAYTFDSEFRENIYKSVEKMDSSSLEKMLLRQGKNACFGYAKSGGTSTTEKFASPLLLIFVALVLALGINYILGRKRYGLSI